MCTLKSKIKYNTLWDALACDFRVTGLEVGDALTSYLGSVLEVRIALFLDAHQGRSQGCTPPRMHSSDDFRVSGLAPALSEVGSSKLEVRSRKLELGSSKLEVRSRKLELRTWKLEVGSSKLEVGSRKLEGGSSKLEVGSWKSEVGN